MLIDNLLKEATEKKKAGELESAINLLKEAYKKISEGSIIYPVGTFLRLPKYLQLANKNDEAWKEFNNLLLGYPNQIKDSKVIVMEHSEIYSAMSNFLIKEGKFELAMRYYIFSYFSWAIGLFKQKRKEELESCKLQNNYENGINKILKKINKENLLAGLILVIKEFIEYLPNINFHDLSTKIDNILKSK